MIRGEFWWVTIDYNGLVTAIPSNVEYYSLGHDRSPEVGLQLFFSFHAVCCRAQNQSIVESELFVSCERG